MRAEQPHCLPRGAAHRRQAEAFDELLDDALRRLAGLDDARGDAERPRGRRDQKRRRSRVMARPFAGPELVLNEPVRGVGVGHTQQRFGEHHQRQALLGRERIGVKKILDAAEAASAGANRLDQARSDAVDSEFDVQIARRLGKEPRSNRLVRRRVGRDERRDLARNGCGFCRRHELRSGSARVARAFGYAVRLVSGSESFPPQRATIFCRRQFFRFGSPQYLALCHGMFFAHGSCHHCSCHHLLMLVAKNSPRPPAGAPPDA